MGLRIEYLLLILLGILFLSILSINPASQLAKSSKGDKELAFHNFSLYDIKKNEPMQEMFATETIKYQHFLEMRGVDLKDESGYRLLAKKAIYENEYIYMNKGVNILRNDGLKFFTKSLDYNVDNKDIKTTEEFRLEFNASIIEGRNLVLNMKNKKITADNIEAKIVFLDD